MRHATGAVLFFNAAHYALRPWPWIIVGLASLIVFPDINALRARVSARAGTLRERGSGLSGDADVLAGRA